MSLSNKALGGYLELDLPNQQSDWLAQAYKFNSARAAFASLVNQLAIRTVWLPRYLCDTMSDVFSNSKIELKFYDLADDFSIKGDPAVGDNALLLYVNYFGVCEKESLGVIVKYGVNKVVIDNSQAFFSKPFDTLATLYSPRKFFGLPDGGLLYSNDPRISQPEVRDTTSATRIGHLISRLTNSPETAYQQYQEAEQSIAEMPILGISELTERLLHAVDNEAARSARNRNACYLHERLGEYNQLKLHVDADTAPLCYPLLPTVKTASRSELINNRVFVPCYWPEVLTRVGEESFEWNLASNGLFLPCDQRYTENDMDRLIGLLAIQ